MRIDSTTIETLNNTAAALSAIRRGYQPIPLVSGDKKARIQGWSRIRWDNSPEGLEHARERFDAWAEEGHGGLGVLVGAPSGGLVDVDLDHPKTARLKDHFLPPTPARSGRASRPNTHYWYVAKEGTLQETRTFRLPSEREAPNERMIVEYRSTGGQTAIPGNVHPEGEVYEWTGEPWGGAEGPAEVDGRVLAVQVALLGFCTLLVHYWPGQGARHDAYLALAGGLLRVGEGGVHPYWERNAGVIIGAIADATNDDEGPEGRVSEVMSSTIKRLQRGERAAGFGKLGEIIGQDAVRQARVILGEIESLAGVPPRSSGELSIEKISEAVSRQETPDGSETGTASSTAPAQTPITPEERAEREGFHTEDRNETGGVRVDPLEDRVGSWEALDLEPYLTGQVSPVEPTVLERSDGQALMYSGRLNMLYGPSESAKSWIAMFTCLQAMERGERVVYLDFEDEPVNALQRMRLIGASYDDLRTSFAYVRPEEPLASMQRSRWGEDRATDRGRQNEEIFEHLLSTHDPSLIVADGMTVLYGLHGLDSNDSVQTDIITSWLKRLTRNGRSTVVLIDHTAKNPQRGSLPIGSQHKVAMVQGTLLQAYPQAQPMPGAVGEVELIVLKDRPGKVRAASEKSGEKAQLAARVIMDSRNEDETLMTVETPSKGSSPKPDGKIDADLRHQRAAERAEQLDRENSEVLSLFEGELGRALSKADLRERLFGTVDSKQVKPADNARLSRTVGRLVDEGWLEKQGSTKDTVYVLQVGYDPDTDPA